MDFIGDSPEGKSKSDFVYQTLRDQILTGTLAPGTALSIRELGSRMEVSRTPVKEAVSRLAFEGYIEVLPNRTVMVSRISTTEILEILEIRQALEHAAAYYAAQRRTAADIAEIKRICERHQAVPPENAAELARWDNKFHLAVARATYNQQMYAILENVFTKLMRITLPISSERAQDSIRQHLAIADAIENGSAAEAQRLMTDHNRDVLSSVKAYQYQNIHLFK